MRKNAVASRHEALQRQIREDTDDTRNGLALQMHRLKTISTSDEAFHIHIDDREAALMTEVLKPNAHKVGLIIGCQRLEELARAAGVSGEVPAVRSAADINLIKLMVGDATVDELKWYSNLARDLLSQHAGYVSRPRGVNTLIWLLNSFSKRALNS